MRMRWMSACLAVPFATLALAQGQAQQPPGPNEEKMHQALQQAFPTAKSQFVGEKRVNGVRVFNVNIVEPSGQTGRAEVTEFGDIMASYLPRSAQNLPQPVTQFLNGLFQKPPQQVEVHHVTRYLADIRVGGKPVRIVADPAGRIVDVRDAEQIAREDKPKFAEASGEQKRGVTPVAERHVQGAKVQRVLKMPDSDNFFLVQMSLPNDRTAELVMNGPSDVIVTRQQIEPSQIPQVVVHSINELFKTDNIQQAFHHSGEYYRVVQPGTGTGQIVMQVQPTGELMNVVNTEVQAQDQAITASHREAPGQPPQPGQPPAQPKQPPAGGDRISQPPPAPGQVPLPPNPSPRR